MTIKKIIILCFIVIMSSIVFAQNNSQKKKIVIGIIGKNSSNPVFMAAHAGAKLAAKDLCKNNDNIEIIIEIKTPINNNAQEQVKAIEALINKKVDGIAISCSDANILTPVIDKAVDNGISVMCFDSDVPKSKRFICYSSDDTELGNTIIKELSKLLAGKGTIAILAGNKNAPNLQKRLQGILDDLKKYPSINLLPNGIFYNEEVPLKAAETVNNAQKANPQIDGWAFIGGWPLYTKNAIKWEPGKVKIVAVNALPEELSYLESGHVQVLIANDCFSWGYKSVELLMNKITLNHKPNADKIICPLTRITKDEAREWMLNWNKWLLKESVSK